MGEARINQGVANTYVESAEALFESGKEKEAIECLEKALEYRPWDKLNVSMGLYGLWKRAKR
jgi:hypothetical protein